jgi:hypothetical protein
MPDTFVTFEEEVESRHTDMLSDLESITVDDLKSGGVCLSFGGKTFKFKDLEIIQDERMEDKLRKEYKEKLNTQQQRIREKINSKINQLLLLHQQKQTEMDRKEKILRKKYADSALMPDITDKHMLKGLSVVKGVSNDELTWVYRAVYNPRFIIIYDETYNVHSKQRKPIPARLVNRLKKDILILIKTKKNVVTSVHTKKTKKDNDHDLELPKFNHYHQTTGGADCWGNWVHPNSWNTPDDLLNIAKEAEAILETINQGSIATRGPTGLPRMATLLEAVQDISEVQATTEEELDNEDVWQAV